MEPIKNSSHFCMWVYMMLSEGGLLKIGLHVLDAFVFSFKICFTKKSCRTLHITVSNIPYEHLKQTITINNYRKMNLKNIIRLPDTKYKYFRYAIKKFKYIGPFVTWVLLETYVLLTTRYRSHKMSEVQAQSAAGMDAGGHSCCEGWWSLDYVTL